MACFPISHEKALHNYFIPCLNLEKTYGRFRKSSEISGSFRKLRKRFKPVFEKLKQFMKIWKIVGKNFRKTSETVQNGFKIFGKPSGVFGDFRKLRKRFESVIQKILWFFKIFWKSSEVFGNSRKFSENFGNGSSVVQMFLVFFITFSENLRKSSEVLKNHRKVSGRDRKCL